VATILKISFYEPIKAIAELYEILNVWVGGLSENVIFRSAELCSAAKREQKRHSTDVQAKQFCAKVSL
jgi:hypothetical protein